MMHKLFAASCLAGIIVTGAAAPMAYAGGGNPSGTGPPSQSCQDSEAAGGTGENGTRLRWGAYDIADLHGP
jgi:hypothetical protein